MLVLQAYLVELHMLQVKPSQAGEQAAEQSGEARPAHMQGQRCPSAYKIQMCNCNDSIMASALTPFLAGLVCTICWKIADSTLQAPLGLPLAMSRRSASAPASTEGGPPPKPQRCTTSPVHASCLT